VVVRHAPLMGLDVLTALGPVAHDLGEATQVRGHEHHREHVVPGGQAADPSCSGLTHSLPPLLEVGVDALHQAQHHPLDHDLGAVSPGQGLHECGRRERDDDQKEECPGEGADLDHGDAPGADEQPQRRGVPRKRSRVGRMISFDAVTDVAVRVLELVPSTPGRLTDKKLIFLRYFPRGSCDSMAYATGAMLLEEDLGDWWVVTQGDGESLHVWLEWKDEDGRAVFSIDTSAHQFDEIDEPFIGYGPTPASFRFSEPEAAVRFSQLPSHWARDGDLALLKHVKNHWW